MAKSDSTGSYWYVCDGTTPGSPVLSDGHTVFTAGLSSTINNLTLFRHEDLLGSLRFQTDSSQSVTGSGLFEAFGAPVGATGTTMPFGFVGGADCQTDADTGLVLMGHRYYDSRIGRFLSQDPAGDGDNWYSYVGNDPVNGLDPSGLRKLSQDELLGMMGQDARYDEQGYRFDSNGDLHYHTSDDIYVTICGHTLLDNPSSGGTSDASMGFGGFVDDTFAFGSAAYAGRMAGGYDAGKVSRGAAIGAGALAVAVIVGEGLSEGREGADVLAGRALLKAKPVGSALKSDMYHRIATFMREEAATNGKHFKMVGGDETEVTLTQLLGEANGVRGRFEYIVDAAGDLTHQLFVRGGTINGLPIVR